VDASRDVLDPSIVHVLPLVSVVVIVMTMTMLTVDPSCVSVPHRVLQ
jgi:hypothetical protein